MMLEMPAQGGKMPGSAALFMAGVPFTTIARKYGQKVWWVRLCAEAFWDGYANGLGKAPEDAPALADRAAKGYHSPLEDTMPSFRFDNRVDFELALPRLIAEAEEPTYILVEGLMEFIMTPVKEAENGKV